MFEVGNEVVCVFDSDRKANEIFRYARFFEILLGELAVRRGRGVQNAAPAICDVRFLRDDVQALHEFGAQRKIAVDSETHHASLTVRKVLIRPLVVRIVRKRRVFYPCNLGMAREERRYLCGVFRVPFHAQGEGVRAEIGKERVLRSHDRAEVANHLRSAFGGKRSVEIRIDETVIAFVGKVESRVSGISLKIEISAVHDDASERGGVTVKVLGRGMNDDVCAELEGVTKRRGRERIVDDEEYAVLFGDLSDFIEVEYDDGRVCDRLAEDEFGLFVDEGFDFFRRRVGVEKSALDSELGQSCSEEVKRSAVHGRGGYDVVACLAEGERGEHGCGHSARATDRRFSSFECGHLAFERRNGRVCKSGIEISVAFQIETIRHGLRIAEEKGRALTNLGNTAFARFGGITCLNAERIFFKFHRFTSLVVFFEFSRGLTLDVAFRKRLFFVVGVLAFTESELHLDERVFEIKLQGNERVAFLVDFSDKFGNLVLVEKKSPVPFRIFRIIRACPVVHGYVGVFQPDVVTSDKAERVFQVHVPCANRFDLSAVEGNACLVSVLDEVFKRGLSVFGNDFHIVVL